MERASLMRLADGGGGGGRATHTTPKKGRVAAE